MEENSSDFDNDCSNSEKPLKFEQLIKQEQETIQKRHNWEFKLEASIKQLYQLKKVGVLD